VNQALKSYKIDIHLVFYYCEVANVKSTITNNAIFHVVFTIKKQIVAINRDAVSECKHEEL